MTCVGSRRKRLRPHEPAAMRNMKGIAWRRKDLFSRMAIAHRVGQREFVVGSGSRKCETQKEFVTAAWQTVNELDLNLLQRRFAVA